MPPGSRDSSPRRPELAAGDARLETAATLSAVVRDRAGRLSTASGAILSAYYGFASSKRRPDLSAGR